MASPRRILRDVTPDSLTAYLADVRRTSVPTLEAEQALARRIQQGDDRAIQELVEGHLRFEEALERSLN
jgi:DNA-directed RNA polymerase sigma subunit (sigma70/sigma32)